MMLGKTCYATAVRDSDGDVQVESERLHTSPALQKASKIPFVRGTVNMANSLVRGMKTLMRSTEIYGEDGEAEAGKFEKWLAKKFNCDLMSVLTVVSAVIGVALAVFLFIIAPNLLLGVIKDNFAAINGTAWESVILGGIKLVFFLAYLGLMLLLPSMRRLYQYHGAEHKTINCYESGKPLTVQNVMASSRIHDRCGTSFMFIVLLVNVVIISLVNWLVGIHKIPNGVGQFFAKLGVELVLLPVIAGVGYEVLKFLARFRGKISAIFKAPGTLMQKVFTTREPDEEMVEVAIAAFERVRQMDEDETIPTTTFITGGLLSQKLAETKALFAKEGIDESDAEWIYSLVLNIKRSELTEPIKVTSAQSKHVAQIVEQRLTGKPLWYIIGDTEFFGCKIRVDERALIPRPETEILAEMVAKQASADCKILDMCTGSGCIAVSVAKRCADKNVNVTAADISEAALLLARENANYNSVNVQFIQSDLFRNIHGRFDIIVCNPPYIKSEDIKTLAREVRDFEPQLALNGGADGLEFYRRIAKDVHRYLTKGGILLLELGEDQLDDVQQLFTKKDYFIPVKDYAGVDRFVMIAF